MAKEKQAPLGDEEAIEILERIARDPNSRPYERLQALTQLERRRKGPIGARAAAAREEADDAGIPPDPLADLDELAVRRAKKARVG
jgi:hypothetical protein